jgi:pimeloyl-ACP methyl ester carboxylesterase
MDSVVTIAPIPTSTPSSGGNDPNGASGPASRSKGHIGWVVVGSLTAGLVTALALVVAPFIPAEESGVTGAALCGFAVGWALLAWLSTRFTDQPQRWALVPALVLGTGGLLLILFGSSVRGVLGWVYPPLLLAVVVWMVVQARRHLRSRSRRLVLYPVVAVMALAAVGGGYETVGAATDAEVAMPGELIEVNGHSMHLNCTGSGSPTVVLQPGGGEMSSNMGWLAPRIAAETRVCVYDRPGRGWSEPVTNPQDATEIASDLHTLLERGNVPGPYVFAGHSFGGLYVLTYAAMFPEDVAGLVVIDTTAPRDEPTTSTPGDPDSYDALGRVTALVSTVSQLGLTRLESAAEVGDLPPESREGQLASLRTRSNLRSFIDEFVQANDSMKRAALLTDFGDKPLFILTAGVGSDADLIAAHDHLATLSTNSVHVTVEGASHHDLISDEKDSTATAQAALAVVASIRNGALLVE